MFLAIRTNPKNFSIQRLIQPPYYQNYLYISFYNATLKIVKQFKVNLDCLTKNCLM